MKLSIKKGVGFGLTSGIITTLGLIIGLNSGTHSRSVVIGGILIIAVADALSDALGMHISEESDRNKKTKQVWESTTATFITKFIFALSFLIPVLLFELNTAMIVSIIWGLLLISIFSYYIAKKEKLKPYKAVFEHLIIAILVVILTNYIGTLIKSVFG